MEEKTKTNAADSAVDEINYEEYLEEVFALSY